MSKNTNSDLINDYIKKTRLKYQNKQKRHICKLEKHYLLVLQLHNQQ